MDIPRLGGGISTKARFNDWHHVPMRSYFYSGERLSLKPVNMMRLARCKVSKNNMAHVFNVNKGPFIPQLIGRSHAPETG